MRRHQQAQVLEYLRILKGAVGELRKALPAPTVLKLLSDSQTLALEVAKLIKDTEGQGTQTASHLEEFSDLLRQGSQSNQSSRDSYFFKKLQVKLAGIENLAKGELKPNKLEILFLPYKYAMADSLESIWLAAMADPQCDVHICPIPYYDRLPNGALGKMHYEGDFYPKDLPLVHWQEYDLEKNRPDSIFIHNPYDDGNHVTSVHPDFYTKRLKKFTHMLCYSPYFVTMEDLKEQFCISTGTIFSDKTLVQSERVRQTYINAYKKFENEKNCKDLFGVAEEKFIAIGSPKFDKCINSKNESYELPDAWKKIIENKRIVLYNTSIGKLLEGNEKYLKKMHNVLETFRNRNDVVLWWRPHPLSETTVRSMRPHLISEYSQIVTNYKREAWGIYDETPDPHPAISHTDAYYGDWSSMVSLYQATGKPIMMSSLDTGSEHPFLPSPVYVTGDSIWFSVRCTNTLLKMDKTNWEPEFVGNFPGESDSTLQYNLPLYQAPTESNGILYFPPFFAKEIATYSLRDNVFEKISFEPIISDTGTARNFITAISYRNFIFFMPYLYPTIIRLNLETKEITYYSDWIDAIKKFMTDPNDAFFLNSLVVGQTIWSAYCAGNAVLEFNMETCMYKVHEVGSSGYRYSGICFDGNNYWLSPRFTTKTPMLKWHPQTGVIKEYPEIHIDENDSFFQPAVYCGGHVWLLPYLAKHALKIDIQTDTITVANEFEFDEQIIENMHSKPRYTFATVSNNNIYAFNQLNKKLVSYDCITKELTTKTITYSPEILETLEPLLLDLFSPDIAKINTEFECYYWESELVQLNSFIEYTTKEHNTEQYKAIMKRRTEVLQSVNVNADGTAGTAIYGFVKELMLK